MCPLGQQPKQGRWIGSVDCRPVIISQRQNPIDKDGELVPSTAVQLLFHNDRTRSTKIRFFFFFFDDNLYVIHTQHAWPSINKFSCIWEGQSWWVRVAHWGRDKMAALFQTTFSNAFWWMKIYEFRLRFHWSLFLRVKLTILQHWFR